jgi:hypothetical protein
MATHQSISRMEKEFYIFIVMTTCQRRSDQRHKHGCISSAVARTGLISIGRLCSILPIAARLQAVLLV